MMTGLKKSETVTSAGTSLFLMSPWAVIIFKKINLPPEVINFFTSAPGRKWEKARQRGGLVSRKGAKAEKREMAIASAMVASRDLGSKQTRNMAEEEL